MRKNGVQWLSVGVLILALLMITALAAPAFAGESRSGHEVTVETGEVVPDDLYCFGEMITIDGTVKGDVIAFGREIHINGTVEGDLLGAAQSIIINGEIGDDARVAMFALQIPENGLVTDDINAAAFSVIAQKGSRIGGDAYVLARQVELGGQLDGSLLGSMDALKIAGTVKGDVTVDVSAPDGGPEQIGPLVQMFPVPLLASGLQIADTATIDGKLTYTSAGIGDISSGAKVGQEVYQTPAPAATPAVTAEPSEEEAPLAVGPASILLSILWWVIQLLRRFITLLVITVLLVWLVPIVIPRAAEKLKEKPWPSLGWGCLAEIVFFVAMPVIFILIIGIGLFLGLLTLGGLQGYFIGIGLLLQALAVAVFAIVTSYVTKIIVSYFVGSWLWEKAKFKPADNVIWPTLVGLVVFVVVRSIPILGWFIGWAVTLFGLGALLLWLHRRLWPPKVTSPLVEQESLESGNVGSVGSSHDESPDEDSGDRK